MLTKSESCARSGLPESVAYRTLEANQTDTAVSISDLRRVSCGQWTILSFPFNAKDCIAHVTLRKTAGSPRINDLQLVDIENSFEQSGQTHARRRAPRVRDRMRTRLLALPEWE